MRTFNTFDDLEQFLREPLFTVPNRQSFPPYTVYQSKDGNETKIEVAIAGYRPDDIDIEFIEGKLHIRGKAPTESLDDLDKWEVLHRGIASRKFDLTFAVNRNYEGESATMADGVLIITLKRIAGFAKKLEINGLKSVSSPQLLKEAA